MPINKNSLQARINNLSAKSGVHQNILLKAFFFDSFLRRLSASKYADSFVFKGGFLLSSSLGVDRRSTMDIDFLVHRMNLDEETIRKVMGRVVNVSIEDNVHFSLKGIERIRQDDEYGGFRVTILGTLESVKETVIIDIATGDPIVPCSIDYQYKCLFSGETLHFQAYNFETILAEKLQTALARGVLNGRSKDFFDIYLIHSLRWEEIDRRVLKEAFSATCAYRHTLFSNAEAKAILRRVEDDLEMSRRWESYRRKNKFVGDVAFRETIEAALLVLKEACPS